MLHPAFLDRESSAITSFADAFVGMQIAMLSASADKIVSSITRTTKKLIDRAKLSPQELSATIALEGDDSPHRHSIVRSMSAGRKASMDALGLDPDLCGFDIDGSAVPEGQPMRCIGSLMIFCGGLVMAIDDEMPLAAEELSTMVDFADSLGFTCFGEQGLDSQRQPCHGNLMFGCLVFS